MFSNYGFALVAELVDAHASGACDPRSWKFESSSGHQKNLSSERFFYALKLALFHNQRWSKSSRKKNKLSLSVNRIF